MPKVESSRAFCVTVVAIREEEFIKGQSIKGGETFGKSRLRTREDKLAENCMEMSDSRR